MGVTPDPGEPDEEPHWWSVGDQPYDEDQPATIPVAPGINVTITPATPTPEPVDTRAHDRRARARRWFLVHGAGAFAGWSFGLYHSIAAFLDTLGPGAPGAGLCLAGFGWFGAEFATERYVRILPSRTRPAAAWALRIPFSTALLTVALHAPNALN
ncbi:hypothetical protein ACFYO0_14510 [Streptomyces sp. NPDC006365]|uniref:hypothetical protein n=1 Tax=Streptomyces sp. NPDC006365 TaxID=3364744 RepID=UPI0036B7F444